MLVIDVATPIVGVGDNEMHNVHSGRSYLRIERRSSPLALYLQKTEG